MSRSFGGALRQWLANFEAGDPVAIGLAGFVILLAVVAGGIWLVDRRNQRRETTRGRSPGRKK